MPLHGFSAEEIRLAAEVVWDRLRRGDDELDIMAELELAPADFADLRRRAFGVGVAETVGKSAEDTFVEYLVAQNRCLRELSALSQKFLRKKKGKDGDDEDAYMVTQPAAYVSAVRAKSEIYDKIVKYGQDLGLVKASKGGLVPGENFHDLTSKDLRAIVVRETAQLDALFRHFGRPLEDEVVGALYSEEKVVPAKRRAK